MKYALNLGTDGRVLSASLADPRTPPGAVRVDMLPEGDIHDYLFAAGAFVHEPILPDPREEAQSRILELKQKLADTDYNILKIVEGAATLPEMAEVIKNRAAWRKEINELEEVYELYKK